MRVLWFVVANFAAFECLLAPDFRRCQWGDDGFEGCLAGAIEDGLGRLTKDFPDVGLPNLEPLYIPELAISPGAGPAAFQQNYKNMRFSGFKNTKVAKVEFDKRVLKIFAFNPLLRLDFEYEYHGKVVGLPISGSGPGAINIYNCSLDLTLELEEYEKNGVRHFRVRDYDFELSPTLVEFKLQNLFGGDKARGDKVNQAMNDNWQKVVGDVKKSYEKAWGRIFASIFDDVGKRVSVEELFGIK